MVKNIKFQLNLFVKVEDDDSLYEVIEKAKEMIREDGLSEYINEDNVVSLKKVY